MASLNEFVSNHWKWILGLFVYAAIGYAGYSGVVTQVDTNKRRLQTYIDVIKEQSEEIDNLQIEVAVLQEQKKCK